MAEHLWHMDEEVEYTYGSKNQNTIELSTISLKLPLCLAFALIISGNNLYTIEIKSEKTILGRHTGMIGLLVETGRRK